MRAERACPAGMLTLLAVLSLIAWGRQARPVMEEQTFQVTGQIRSLDATNKTARIAHDEIQGYMPAMTMPFAVKNAVLLQGLKANDSVKFELVVTKDDAWITRIEKTAPDITKATAATAPLPDRESERVQTGEKCPTSN